MNTLLLSTANDLFWLGRYMQRSMKLQARLFIHKDTDAHHYLQLMGIEIPTECDDPENFIRTRKLPYYFEMINNNVYIEEFVRNSDRYTVN